MEILHDPVGQKFYVPLGKEEEAVVAYTQINEYLDVHHVFVPDAFRGQGLSERMVKFAFDFAKRNRMKIIPSCPYVKEKFLPEHPEYRDIVSEEMG